MAGMVMDFGELEAGPYVVCREELDAAHDGTPHGRRKPMMLRCPCGVPRPNDGSGMLVAYDRGFLILFCNQCKKYVATVAVARKLRAPHDVPPRRA